MRASTLATASLAAVMAVASFAGAAGAQDRPLRLNVKPRSWLELGPAVAPYSQSNPASAYGQTASYLLNPPYQNMRDRFGEGVLPDPITNGPFIGATNLLGPIDFGTSDFGR